MLTCHWKIFMHFAVFLFTFFHILDHSVIKINHIYTNRQILGEKNLNAANWKYYNNICIDILNKYVNIILIHNNDHCCEQNLKALMSRST